MSFSEKKYKEKLKRQQQSNPGNRATYSQDFRGRSTVFKTKKDYSRQKKFDYQEEYDMFNFDRSLLTDKENRLVDLWSNIYNAFNSIDLYEDTWYVKGPDYDETYSSKEEMLKDIEYDVKEALLQYALNGELSELL